MIQSYRKFIVAGFVGIVALSGALLLLKRLRAVDFVDNPALLISVSEIGIAKLDTRRGDISAPLAKVDWRNDEAFLTQAQQFIRLAQRDTVAFARTDNGDLLVWYDTESGAQSLNDQIKRIPTNR